MRGKPYVCACRGRGHRITPAGAGKTLLRSCVIVGVEDHPRRCGENCIVHLRRSAGQGSPPQVRGKLTKVKQGIAEQRITPAGAGKTLTLHGILKTAQDHPRRCGENKLIPPLVDASTGSPPQVRGKPYVCACRGRGHRITPAGAGKTLLRSCVIVGVEDHPRRCGENLTVCRIITFRPGSPPQVRGKLNHASARRDATGITPAGAGKTFSPFLTE